MAFGIPPLLNKVAGVVNTASLLAADVGSFLGMFGAPQWGIFKDGTPVILADSVIEVDFKKEWRIADYPVEQGAFQSYNKVETPFDAKVKLSKGGKEADRQEFLDTIDDIAGTLDLYDVVTPEKTYIGANISHYDYRRQALNGVGIIVVELFLVEVRATATATFANPDFVGPPAPPITDAITPSGMDPTNGGLLQSLIPSGIQIPKITLPSFSLPQLPDITLPSFPNIPPFPPILNSIPPLPKLPNIPTNIVFT